MDQPADEETPLIAYERKESPLYWWCMMLGLPFALCVGGVLFLSFTEKWSLIVSAYVITQMLTTIGYGDFTVTETSSKVFVSIFSILILTFGAYAVGILAEILINSQSDKMRAHLRRLEGVNDTDQNPYRHVNAMMVAVLPAVLFVIFGTFFFRWLEHCTCGMDNSNPDCLDSDFQTCVATGGYVKDTTNAFYMSVITLTTIGFGDYQPRTGVGRMVSIPWMLLGVAIFGNFLATLSQYFYEERKNANMLAAEAMHTINKKNFDKIDRDGNGTLSPNEFLIYSLLKYDIVSEELVDQILEQYEACDGAKERAVTFKSIMERQRSMLAKRGLQLALINK